MFCDWQIIRDGKQAVKLGRKQDSSLIENNQQSCDKRLSGSLG